MSSQVTSLLNVVPTNISKRIPKFVTDDTVVIDLPFKISTKYTAVLLIILLCLSFGNQFFRDVDIQCWDIKLPFQQTAHDNANENSNDFCWNQNTFLVVKALEPHWKGRAIYPGVLQSNRGLDDVITQRYYKFIWFIFAILAVISFLPYFIWKVKGKKKVKPLVDITSCEDYSEDIQRLDYFLDTVGFNDTFAWFYVGCKFIGTLSPLAQWYLLCGFIGKKFKFYGIDVLRHFLDETDPWPHPMDIVFPKMTKCEWNKLSITGNSVVVRAAICQMPMNNITQWSFLIYWLWMALVFLINIISLLYLLFHCFQCCRRYKYQKLIGAVCSEDVEKLRNYNFSEHDKEPIKKHEVIFVDVSFGDWLVLSFLEQNLDELKFKKFIRQIATTKNTILQLHPVKMSVPIFGVLNEVDSKQNPAVDERKETLIDKEPEHSLTYPQNASFESNEHQCPVIINARVKVDRKRLKKMDGPRGENEPPKPTCPEENLIDEESTSNPMYPGMNRD